MPEKQDLHVEIRRHFIYSLKQWTKRNTDQYSVVDWSERIERYFP